MTFGLLTSPIIFLKSFEHKWVANYGPQLIQQKASGEYREWIYFVYAKETLTRPFFGHGFEATQFRAGQFGGLFGIGPRATPWYGCCNLNVMEPSKRMPIICHCKLYLNWICRSVPVPAVLWVLLNIEFVKMGRAVRAAAVGAVIGLCCLPILYGKAGFSPV